MELIKIETKSNTSSNDIHSKINLGVKNSGIKIWLVDPTYTQQQISSESMPTAIGGIATFTEKYLKLKQEMTDKEGVDTEESNTRMVKDLYNDQELFEFAMAHDEYLRDEDHWFYRKGVVGDWKNYFDEKMLKKISLIEQFLIESEDITNRIKSNLNLSKDHYIEPYTSITLAIYNAKTILIENKHQRQKLIQDKNILESQLDNHLLSYTDTKLVNEIKK